MSVTSEVGLDRDQQQLAADHVHLVERVARNLFHDSPRLVDEFIGDGYVGLCVAARSFDPARGCRFEAYASFRIHGAMCDAARATWGRDPRDRRARHRARYVTGLNAVSLDAAIGERRDSTIADVVAVASDADEEHDERVDRLAAHRARLPERVNLVLDESFGRGRSLEEIGRSLGVTASRVSQIRTQGVRRLQRAMAVAVDDRGARERILAELARVAPGRPGLTVDRLARRTKARPGHCRGLVRRMSADGLVECEHDDTDRRRLGVRITDRGRRALEELTSASAA